MAVLRTHQENLCSNGARAKLRIKCDECIYQTTSENNLEVHKSEEHSLVAHCKLCEKEFRTESELLVHEELDHKRSKFSCTECARIFPSSRRMQDHMQYQHGAVSHYPCDYCGHKFENLSRLDEHITSTHSFSDKRKPNKDIDICDLSNRKPCNPASPRHTTDCCDRKPRGAVKRYSKVCYFQENCRYGWKYCRFSHISREEQNQSSSFLDRRSNQEHFQQERISSRI